MQPGGERAEGQQGGGGQLPAPVVGPAPQPQPIAAAPSPSPTVMATPAQPAVANDEDFIEWEASEYIQHDKGAGWLIILGVVTLVAVAAAIWFQQWFFAGLLVLMAVALGYYAVRPPKTIHYRLSDVALEIGGRHIDLAQFRSFGVVSDGAFHAIHLMPTKRLAPATVIYFGEEDGEDIVDILGSQMPMEQIKLDPIDVIMRKLHF